ncbi:metallophosphoesterase domain-containing protein 1 [Cubamyces lactineus]|nr:metallophosphoesterase domain-containing protein 1 [Cubamyces lactineus]
MSLDALLHRREPTAFELFTQDPLRFLARKAYESTSKQPELAASSANEVPVRVVCISDTHSQHAKLGTLPDGDILIHAGDLTHSGTPEELRDALQWLASQPHTHKIFIAGNHDRALSDDDARATLLDAFPALVYLQQSATTIAVRERTFRIYGSPLTPAHGSWAFQYPRASPVQAQWDSIPPDTDILITHGPPVHHVDKGSGCAALLSAVWKVRPRLHICGHIHAARGVESLTWTKAQAAYERILARTGGWWDLLVVFFGGVFGRTSAKESTILVNAASLGGFRDEQVRGAIVIDL